MAYCNQKPRKTNAITRKRWDTHCFDWLWSMQCGHQVHDQYAALSGLARWLVCGCLGTPNKCAWKHVTSPWKTFNANKILENGTLPANLSVTSCIFYVFQDLPTWQHSDPLMPWLPWRHAKDPTSPASYTPHRSTCHPGVEWNGETFEKLETQLSEVTR